MITDKETKYELDDIHFHESCITGETYNVPCGELLDSVKVFRRHELIICSGSDDHIFESDYAINPTIGEVINCIKDLFYVNTDNNRKKTKKEKIKEKFELKVIETLNRLEEELNGILNDRYFDDIGVNSEIFEDVFNRLFRDIVATDQEIRDNFIDEEIMNDPIDKLLEKYIGIVFFSLSCFCPFCSFKDITEWDLSRYMCALLEKDNDKIKKEALRRFNTYEDFENFISEKLYKPKKRKK